MGRHVAIGYDVLADDVGLLRIGVSVTRDGDAPPTVGRLVRVALDQARRARVRPRLLVLPAAIGRIDEAAVRVADGRRGTGGAVLRAIETWTAALCSYLPRRCPPLLLGLVGRVTLPAWERCDGPLRLVLFIVNRRLAEVRWRCQPRDGFDSGIVETAWDMRRRRVTVDGVHCDCDRLPREDDQSGREDRPRCRALQPAPLACGAAFDLARWIPERDAGRAPMRPWCLYACRSIRCPRDVEVIGVAGPGRGGTLRELRHQVDAQPGSGHAHRARRSAAGQGDRR